MISAYGLGNSEEMEGFSYAFNFNNLGSDYTSLLIIWEREKLSEELLPYREDLIPKLSAQIEKRKSYLKSLNLSEGDEFMREILELDLERVLFVFKDYLRIRLAKIEKFLFQIIQMDLGNLLSNKEFDYAFKLFTLKRAYFTQNVYSKLNDTLNDLKKIKNQVIVSPNLKLYSFAKNLSRNSTPISIKDNYENSEEPVIEVEFGETICLPENLLKVASNLTQIALI